MTEAEESELENHVVAVTEAGKMLLHHIFEGRRATEEDNGVGAWSRHVLFQHVSRHEANTVVPRGCWLHINCVVELEAVGIVSRELVELIF